MKKQTKLTVLLAGDSAESLSALGRALRGRANTEQAVSCGEALHTLAKQSTVDLVLLDIRVPESDCFSLLDWKRQNPEFAPECWAVVAGGEIDLQLKALDSGADDLLLRPLHPRLLLHRLQRLENLLREGHKAEASKMPAGTETASAEKRKSPYPAEKFTALLNNIPGGVLTCRLADTVEILAFNEKTALLFGFSREEYSRRFAQDALLAFHEEDASELRRQILALGEGKAEQETLFGRHIRRDGGWCWIHIFANVVRREKKTVYVGFLYLNAEEQLELEQKVAVQRREIEQQQKYIDALLEIHPHGHMVYREEKGVKCLADCNEAAWRMFGYSSREDCLCSRQPRFPLLQQGDPITGRYAAASAGELLTDTQRVFRPNGGSSWVRVLLRKAAAESEQSIDLFDMAEQKRENLQQYIRTLLRLYHRVYEVDTKNDISFCCMDAAGSPDLKETVKHLEAARAGFLNHAVGEKERERLKAFLDFSSLPEVGQNREELFRLRGEMGALYWVRILLLHSGAHIFLICLKDVSQQHNEEAQNRLRAMRRGALREQQAVLARDRILLSHGDFRLSDLDIAKDELSLWEKDERGQIRQIRVPHFLAGLPDNDIFCPEDRDTLIGALNRARDFPVSSCVSLKRKDASGTYAPVRFEYESVADENGSVYRIVGVTRPFPEPEAKPQSSPFTRLKELSTFGGELENNAVCTYVVEADGFRIVFCNQAFRQKWGRANLDSICYRTVGKSAGPCTLCPMRAQEKYAISLPVPVQKEEKDGLSRFFGQAVPCLWKGRRAFLITLYEPLSSAQKELTSSEKKMLEYVGVFRELYDEAVELDFGAGTFRVLFSRKRADGLPTQGLEQITENFINKLIYKEDRARILEFFKEEHLEGIITAGQLPTCDCRGLNADGSLQWRSVQVLRLSRRVYLVLAKNSSSMEESAKVAAQPEAFSALKETMRRYSFVLHALHISLAEWDFSTHRFTCTEGYYQYQLSHYDPLELPWVGVAQQTVCLADHALLLDLFTRLRDPKTDCAKVTLRLKTEKDSLRRTYVQVFVTRGEDGRASRCLGVFCDLEEVDWQFVSPAQKWLEETVNRIPVGLGLYELSNQIIPRYIGSRTCEMFGFTKEEYDERIARGEPINYTPPPSEFSQAGLRSLQEGQIVTIPRMRVQRKDGSWFWLRSVSKAVQGENGKMLLYSALSDVTQECEREQELCALRKSLSFSVYKCRENGEGQFRYIREELLKRLGFTKTEFMDKTLQDYLNMIYEADRSRMVRTVRRQIRTGQAVSAQFRVVDRRGQQCWINCTGSFVLDAAGMKWYYVFLTDIDEQKKSEEQQKKERQAGTMLLAAMAGGFVRAVVKGEKSEVNYISPGVQRLFGYSEPELFAQYAGESETQVHPDDRAALRALFGRAAETRKPQEIVCRRLCRSGDYRWVRLQVTWIETGEQTFAYGIYTDASRVKELEEKLETLRRKLTLALGGMEMLFWEYNIAGKTCRVYEPGIRQKGRMLANMPYSAEEEGVVEAGSMKAFFALHEAVCQGRACAMQDLRMCLSDGGFRWYRLIYHTLFENGAAVGAIGVSFDINDEKQRQSDLEKEMDEVSAKLGNTLLCKGEVNVSNDGVENYRALHPALTCEDAPSYQKLIRLLSRYIQPPESRSKVENALSAKRLADAFAKGKRSLEVEYKNQMPGELLPSWTQIALKLYLASDGKMLRAFLRVYDIEHSRNTYRLIHRTMREHYEMLGILTVKPATLRVFLVYDDEIDVWPDSSAPHSYPEALAAYVSRHVPTEYKERALVWLSAETIDAALRRGKRYTAVLPVTGRGRVNCKKWECVYLDDSRTEILYARSEATPDEKPGCFESKNQLCGADCTKSLL